MTVKTDELVALLFELWKKGHKSIHSYVDSMQNMYKFKQNILRQSKYTKNFTKRMITHLIEI